MQQVGEIVGPVMDKLWDRDRQHLDLFALNALGLENDRWLARSAKDEIRRRFEKMDDHELWPYLKAKRWPMLQKIAGEILTARSRSYLIRGILIVKDILGEMLDDGFPVNIIMEAANHTNAAEKALRWAEGVNQTRHKQPVRIETLRLQAKKHPGKSPQPPKSKQPKLC